MLLAFLLFILRPAITFGLMSVWMGLDIWPTQPWQFMVEHSILSLGCVRLPLMIMMSWLLTLRKDLAQKDPLPILPCTSLSNLDGDVDSRNHR